MNKSISFLSIIYVITFLFVISTIPVQADGSIYNFQSTACNEYQNSDTIGGLTVKILKSCKKEFRSIDDKLKIIDSEFVASDDPKYKHVIKLKVHSFNRQSGIIDYHVYVTEKSPCDSQYEQCSSSCNKSIKTFSCTIGRDAKCSCE